MSFVLPDILRGFVPTFDTEKSVKVVEAFLMNNSIQLDTGIVEVFDPEVFWSATRERSEGRKAHAWFFLRDFYSGYEGLSSVQRQQLVDFVTTQIPVWKKLAAAERSMAYHDETTAQRVINTSMFAKVFEAQLAPKQIQVFETHLSEDVALLGADNFYAGQNNHGMFQDIALLVAHRLGFASEMLERKAVQRLTEYFDSCFTVDGIHTENNPTYHVMVSSYLAMVATYLEATDRSEILYHLKEILAKADKYAGFCVLPNTQFPPISDTKVVDNTPQKARRVFGEGAFLAAITHGNHGVLPNEATFIAEESGYAIFRDGWDKHSSFAMLSAAYNADYHKHSDELSLYVYANSRPLLAEAGPNGYQYQDPLTKYAFSSAAHNSLLVDGLGLPRVDGNSHLTTLRKEADQVVTGRTQRYKGVDWYRQVDATEWAQRGLLKVNDTITSDEKHTYTLLWHLGEQIEAVVRGNFVELFDKPTEAKVGELYVSGSALSAVRRVKGQVKPCVQGFSFPAMGRSVPTTTVEFDIKGTEANLFWKMRTRDFKLRDRGITPTARGWHTFYGEKPVRYLLDWDQQTAPDRLLVVFSAVNERNDFTYNYRASLKEFPGAVAYIIDDFGDQGSYYLANGRNKAEFRSVQAALRHIVSELGLRMGNVYTMGSSKGGAGAIMHGVAAGVRQVFAGGPQYKIGLFTSGPHPNILNYIAGGETEGDQEWANNAMHEVLMEGDRRTKLTVMVGLADGHYKYHAVPLTDDARELGYEVRLLTLPGTTHSELGPVFRGFVKSIVEALNEGTVVAPHAVGVDNEKRIIGLCVDADPDWLVLAQWQKDGQVVGKPARVTEGVVTHVATEPGVYRARVYIDRKDEQGRKAFGTARVRVR